MQKINGYSNQLCTHHDIFMKSPKISSSSIIAILIFWFTSTLFFAGYVQTKYSLSEINNLNDPFEAHKLLSPGNATEQSAPSNYYQYCNHEDIIKSFHFRLIDEVIYTEEDFQVPKSNEIDKEQQMRYISRRPKDYVSYVSMYGPHKVDSAMSHLPSWLQTYFKWHASQQRNPTSDTKYIVITALKKDSQGVGLVIA